MTKPPYQINSSLRKNYPAHHPQESGGGMVDDVVPISLGGTGATTAEGARDNLGTNDASNLTTGTLPNARVSNSLTPDKAFRRGNILGTVSQSSGVPTGAIIERGSNANGQYVRYADGTQICWRTISVNSNSYVTFTMPSAFSNASYFAVANQNFENANLLSVKVGNRTTTTANVAIIDQSGFTTSSTMSLFAIGRWF